MHGHLDALEAQLGRSGGPWILGSHFTLADISWMAILERLRESDYEHVYFREGTRPLAASYWKRLRERPSYARAILGHSHPSIERGSARLRETKRALPALERALESA